ncbi:hypothetical protein [Mycobacterium sp. URHB0044]|jgi:hypothetical protein|uniref:hypothetical protein n=1 Tax=Mycobacterium sp. URHB0044 TaxID=1380386 RepID=UPI000491F447|nr:hypothetical protein [Mycobacterium sp. URHB0044]
MAVATGRPDLAAYNEAVGMSPAELVTALRSLLGAKLVAYIGGVKETRAVRQWAEGSRNIANPSDVERLRVAYRAARVVNLKDNTQIVQAWFQGLNPFLDDVSPARVLRDGDVDADGPRVIAAARQYAAVG